ncbi:MAG: acetyl-CoA decarbonylase/synthase complex subunit delta [Chloroflexi bacterium]|jgi:acetyl-CoA decarbonylase/synthase complex subunit delta|nr:acetyl-CoA decarbonylase/synthase complex subunit delta [Chloroflexota bacterium]
MAVEIPKEKWSGTVREVTLGATREQGGTRTRTLTVGGETAMPHHAFEGSFPHPPALALEVRDRKPTDWSPLLLQAWGAAMDDPAAWAKAAEQAGAELIFLTLSATLADGKANTAANARAVVRKVLEATGLPLAVIGPGQAEIDNELIVAAAEEGKGERLLIGTCEDKNYRTIVAGALANDHVVQSKTPMDVNLSKQLVILIHDMGLPLERIIMDPTTGALGYGIEYGYSVMERLRLAALQGDSMTQQPLIVTPGEEGWKVKEAKVGEGVPAAWGDWNRRALNWEALTANALIYAGADIIVLRHPETLRRLRGVVDALMAA